MANKFVVLGGGVSAGYFARAFVEKGFPKGSLVMVSSDTVLPCKLVGNTALSCHVSGSYLKIR